MFQGVEQLGVLEQRLGGNAAVIIAGAAGAVLVDTGDFLAELRCLDGSDVAGRTGADDDKIVVGHKIRNGKSSIAVEPEPAAKACGDMRASFAG